MIALVLAALLSTGREIVFVMPQLLVRHDAITVELVDFLEPEDRVAVVDGELRLLQDFTTDRKALRTAIRSTRLGAEELDVAGRLLVVATYGVNEPNAEPMQLPPGTLVLNTSRAGEISAGFVTERGVTLHPRMSLRRVAELAPKLVAPPAPGQEPPQEPPHELAMKLFVDAMRRLHDGDEEGVEATLDEVIATDPQLADAWYERGMLAAAREDHEAAQRDLKKYLALAPRGKHAADARDFLDALQAVRPR